MREAMTAPNTPTRLGLKRMATKRWSQAFDRHLPDAWTIPDRRERTPKDAVNALLSFGDTLLFHHRVPAACLAWPGGSTRPWASFTKTTRPQLARLRPDGTVPRAGVPESMKNPG